MDLLISSYLIRHDKSYLCSTGNIATGYKGETQGANLVS